MFEIVIAIFIHILVFDEVISPNSEVCGIPGDVSFAHGAYSDGAYQGEVT